MDAVARMKLSQSLYFYAAVSGPWARDSGLRVGLSKELYKTTAQNVHPAGFKELIRTIWSLIRPNRVLGTCLTPN